MLVDQFGNQPGQVLGRQASHPATAATTIPDRAEHAERLVRQATSASPNARLRAVQDLPRTTRHRRAHQPPIMPRSDPQPITPPGVLPTQAGTQLRYLSALDDRSSCLALLPLPARTSRRRPGLGYDKATGRSQIVFLPTSASMQNGSPGLHTATGTHPDHCAVARHRRWWSTSSARPPTPKPS